MHGIGFEVPKLKDITKQCGKCAFFFVLTVVEEDYEEWRGGEFVQKAFPYLSTDQRELLISGICGTCFDGMFPDE